MAIQYPKPGKAALLSVLLDKEVHFELGTNAAARPANSVTLGTPVLRKRVFNKGFAKNFKDRPMLTLGYTADAGAPGTTVTTLVTRLSPMKWLAYAGDLTYNGLGSGLASSLAPFDAWRNAERLLPSWGNHDQDHANGLANILAQFTYLTAFAGGGNGRYYGKDLTLDNDPTVKIAHLTAYHSGLNTAGDAMEPDGTNVSSDQAEVLKDLANASTAPWKICVVHHPPVTGGTQFREELAHLMDGTWDLILCGHAHRVEEINVNGICTLLNVSSVKENRGSSDLQGAVDTGITKTYEHDTARAGCRIYVTEDTLAWEIFDITSGFIIRQSHVRKPSAPYYITTTDGVKYYLTAEETNTVLLQAMVEPADLANGITIRELGIFVDAEGKNAPGEPTVTLANIEDAGNPLVIEDQLELAHNSATAITLARAITL